RAWARSDRRGLRLLCGSNRASSRLQQDEPTDRVAMGRLSGRDPGVRARLRYTRYLPMINSNFFLVVSGISRRSLIKACARAWLHLQVRSAGIAATAALTTLAAFSAFLTRFATISFTVTASWPGCQQS